MPRARPADALGPAIRVLLVLAILAIAPAAARAQGLERVVEVAGKLVPLPPGRWLPLADAAERLGDDPFAVRVLARIEDGAAAAMVIARASLARPSAPASGPGECGRDDIHLAHIAYDTAVDGLCLFVNHVVLSGAVEGPPVWLAARGELMARGAVVTDTWLVVGIRARTAGHAVDVRYYFAPPDFRSALPERGWSDNRWSPERASADADRAASIRRLGIWAAWVREAVELGLRGQIPVAALPPSPWEGPDLGQRLAVHRLGKLQRLRAAGLVGPEEYERQRRQVVQAGIDPGRSEVPLWRRNGWRRIRHAAASAAESLGVSYLVIGSLLPSLGFAAILEAASPIGRYLHALAWPDAAAEADAGPSGPRDFAEIGHKD